MNSFQSAFQTGVDSASQVIKWVLEAFMIVLGFFGPLLLLVIVVFAGLGSLFILLGALILLARKLTGKKGKSDE